MLDWPRSIRIQVKISYQDFVYRWSTRFIEAGLPANAGEDVDANDEIG